MSEFGPEWYDRQVAPGAPALVGLEESPYRPLYQRVSRYVRSAPLVVELGCGTGRFARQLQQDGFDGDYVGVDFAPGCVAESQRYAPHPNYRYEVADLRDMLPFTTGYFVALEVLEHFADDLGLLARLPDGCPIAISVPTFDSESHVRYFPAADTAIDRYAAEISIDQYERIPVPGSDTSAFHLIIGTS